MWPRPMRRLLSHLPVKWGWWPFNGSRFSYVLHMHNCIDQKVSSGSVSTCLHPVRGFLFFSNMHSSPVTTIANTLSTWIWAWVKSQAWQSTNGILPWVFKRPFICINGKTQKDYIMDWVCAIRVCMCVCRCTLPRAFACAYNGRAAFHATDLMSH